MAGLKPPRSKANDRRKRDRRNGPVKEWWRQQLTTRAIGGILISGAITLITAAMDQYNQRQLLRIEQLSQQFREKPTAQPPHPKAKPDKSQT